MSDITKQQAVQMTSNKPQSTINNQNSQDLQSAICNPNIAISVKNLSKKYQLYDTLKHRLKEALHPFRKKYHNEFWALRDISFEIKRGETVGIIGRNGSGKSTLLQVICGILTPTSGETKVNGRVSALLELGAGFDPEFTGRENVYMNGAILGLSREEMNARLDDIAAFADIGDFLNQPVKTYSSGMYVRLAFACAINTSPDILIIDEALAVGDVFFQLKCFDKIKQIKENGITILFVSHDMSTISNLCERVALLENGHSLAIGKPKEVIDIYNGLIFEETSAKRKKEEFTVEKAKEVAKTQMNKNQQRYGNGKLKILSVNIYNKKGDSIETITEGEQVKITIKAQSKKGLDNVNFAFSIYDNKGNCFYMTSTEWQKREIPRVEKDQILKVSFSFPMSIGKGEYLLNIAVTQIVPEGYQRLDWIGDYMKFDVIGGRDCSGFCYIKPEIEIK
jgi:ABC-type polysaccharide/polyol phosphate transport system ATPase subunit